MMSETGSIKMTKLNTTNWPQGSGVLGCIFYLNWNRIRMRTWSGRKGRGERDRKKGREKRRIRKVEERT
jgi:hypothetical protein